MLLTQPPYYKQDIYKCYIFIYPVECYSTGLNQQVTNTNQCSYNSHKRNVVVYML